MKPLVPILAISLAANAALVTHVVRLSSGSFGTPQTTSSSASTANTPAASVGNAQDVAVSTAATSAMGNIDWASTTDGDLQQLAQRLRTAGLPPHVVRAIISAQIRERSAAKRKALLAGIEEAPYWQRSPQGLDPKTMSELREISRADRKLLNAIAGADASGTEEQHSYQRRQYGNLPSDKLEAVQAIVSDYGDLRSEIYSNANGMLLREDREKLALLEREQRTDLSSVLTPEELEGYEIRSSYTASFMRSQISVFKPTEEEFRGVFRALRTAEEQYGAITPNSMNSSKMKQYADSVLESQKAMLSPERYALLEQALDPRYHAANRVVARLDLPPSAAVSVVETQRAINSEAAAIRRNQELSNQQKAQQLNGLADKAEASIAQVLTPRGLEAYKTYQSAWFQSLRPRAPAAQR